MARYFSTDVKAEAFKRCGGKCEKCGMPFKRGECEFDHIVPYALTQDSSLGNCQVLCVPCHRGPGAKTSMDVSGIRKSDRNWKKHNGIKSKSSLSKRTGMKFNWKTGRYERES